MIDSTLFIKMSHSSPMAKETSLPYRRLQHKYLSAGEALALANIFAQGRQKLALKFKIRLRITNFCTKLVKLFHQKPQTQNRLIAQDQKCPNFDQLLARANNFSSDYYEMVQKRFGIDFRPNYLSKNNKLITEIDTYHKVSESISKANIGTINYDRARQNKWENDSSIRRSLLDFKVPLYQSAGNQYAFQISAACVINNEARFLKEWLDFHILIGIEHFFLFNNRSTDDYFDVLAPYVKQGIVDIINWDTGSATGDQWIYLEAEALSSALRLAHGRSKWLALIDTDEYLFPVQTESLSETLQEFEPYGSVSVRYTVFGTSSVERIPSDKLLIETLTRSCTDTSQHNKLFKSIVRPEFVDSCINSHFCELMPGFINITEDLKPLNPETIGNIQNKKLALNHYWTRDLDYFKAHKLPRLSNWGISADECMRNIAELNAIERTDILRFVPALKDQMSDAVHQGSKAITHKMMETP